MSIYQEIILDHYRNPRNFGTLKDAVSLELSNPLCGDVISMSIKYRDNKIEEINFMGKGCAISIASASLLTEYVKGKSIDELRNLTKSSILEMLGIELSPNRLKCALLPLEILKKVIEQHA